MKGEDSLSPSLTLTLRGALPACTKGPGPPAARTLPRGGMRENTPSWLTPRARLPGRAASLQPYPGAGGAVQRATGRARPPLRAAPHAPSARPGGHVRPAPLPGPWPPARPASHPSLFGHAFTARLGRVGRAANNITTRL